MLGAYIHMVFQLLLILMKIDDNNDNDSNENNVNNDQFCSRSEKD